MPERRRRAGPEHWGTVPPTAARATGRWQGDAHTVHRAKLALPARGRPWRAGTCLAANGGGV